jgi:hypothetical protein
MISAFATVHHTVILLILLSIGVLTIKAHRRASLNESTDWSNTCILETDKPNFSKVLLIFQIFLSKQCLLIYVD